MKVMHERPDATTTEAALRLVRNDLAHGYRSYPAPELHDVTHLIEHGARGSAHAGWSRGPGPE